jgi:hypothetical protein
MEKTALNADLIVHQFFLNGFILVHNIEIKSHAIYTEEKFRINIHLNIPNEALSHLLSSDDHYSSCM